MSKYVSDHIGRLQVVNFKFEDKPFEVLVSEYDNIIGSLKWWCNKNKQSFIDRNDDENEGTSMFDINRYKWLKQFLILYPPTFTISSKCCDWSKKKSSKKFMKETNCDLMIIGVRKAEGGIRASAYKNCYTQGENQYRPLFWFKQEDKKVYEEAFDIHHSDCYSKYGFERTGCVCCPYGRNLVYELAQTKIYEPNMYKAVSNVFKDSYEYTRQYRQFVKEMNAREKGRRRLF